MKWDYVKMEIRSICILLSRKKSRGNKLELEHTEDEIQRVTKHLIKLEADKAKQELIAEANEALGM